MSILSNLQTRQLGLFELIAMGYSLYFKHFRSFLSLVCVIYLPAFVLFQALSLSLAANPILIIPYLIVNLLFFLVVTPVYTSAIAIFTENYVLERKPQLKFVIKRILSQITPLIGIFFRYGIVFYLRLFLLIIPGIIYSVNNGYCSAALILRDQRGKAAFQYSRSLVKGHWWKVFSFYLLILLLSFGLQLLFTKILNNFIPHLPIVASVLSVTLATLTALGAAISSILLFLNLDFLYSSPPPSLSSELSASPR